MRGTARRQPNDVRVTTAAMSLAVGDSSTWHFRWWAPLSVRAPNQHLILSASARTMVCTFLTMGAILNDARYSLRTLKRTPVHTAAAGLVVALGIGTSTAIFSVVHAASQAAAGTTDELFTRLAIETAPDSEVPAIQLVVDGSVQFAVYDRFRLVSLAAREALRTGRRLEPGALPPTLLVPRLVILAFARTPMGSDTTRPQAIKLTDRTGRAVSRLATLAPVDLAALLPGVSIAPLTLAASFAEPELRPGDHVTVVFNQVDDLRVSRGLRSVTPGETSAAVAFKAPAAIATPMPALPSGVGLPKPQVDVHVSAVLDLTGHVRYARAFDGPADLQAAAIAAVSLWTYTPATIYNAPVPVAMQVAVQFRADR
jgi:hypothetical protein